jgi:Zn-finger nucleic acid-binding protein
MKCPIDDVDLHMAERHGIEIDYCPKCRGVWLDRGELDKILERAAVEYRPGGVAGERERRYDEPRREEHREERRREDEWREGRHDDRQRKRKKPGGFLGDLFEGFGD